MRPYIPFQLPSQVALFAFGVEEMAPVHFVCVVNYHLSVAKLVGARLLLLLQRYHVNEYIHRKKMTMYPRGPKGVRFPTWMYVEKQGYVFRQRDTRLCLCSILLSQRNFTVIATDFCERLVDGLPYSTRALEYR